VLPLPASRKQALPAQNCFPFCFAAVAPLIIALLAVLCLCTCQAFPGPPLLLYASYHSSTLRIFEYCGWDGPGLLQETRPEDHLCCLYCHCRTTEYAFEVHTWSLACPHLVSFLYPVPILQKDVSHRLSSAAVLALVGLGLVDGVEVGTEADLACMYLCDYRAD
jgi:hypothetical protein